MVGSVGSPRFFFLAANFPLNFTCECVRDNHFFTWNCFRDYRRIVSVGNCLGNQNLKSNSCFDQFINGLRPTFGFLLGARLNCLGQTIQSIDFRWNRHHTNRLHTLRKQKLFPVTKEHCPSLSDRIFFRFLLSAHCLKPKSFRLKIFRHVQQPRF